MNILKSRKTVAVIVALILSYISARFLAQGTALVTIPWGVAAVIFGMFSKSKKEALLLGVLLGFVASYSYLWFDNTSHLKLTQVVFLIFLIILPAFFGALCGLAASWIGWSMKKKISK